MHKEQFYYLISAGVGRITRIIRGRKDPDKILVIKWDEIGDMVYAIPVLDQLKERFPNAKITLWCKPFVQPLVQHHPAVDQLVQEAPEQEHFPLIVELRGNWSTLKYSLLHQPAAIYERGTVRFANKLGGGQKHEWYTNFEIIRPLLHRVSAPVWPQIHIDEESRGFTGRFIQSHQLSRYVVLHAGARKKLRQWPVVHFAALANILSKTHQMQLVFAGTEEDEPVIEQIIQTGHLNAVVCTRGFSLLHFAALVEKAALFVGNESGPLHIAAAMKTPLVGIFGPGVKEVFYPIGAHSAVVHHVLDCNPCDQEHCVRPENPCIQLATIEEVVAATEKVLGINPI